MLVIRKPLKDPDRSAERHTGRPAGIGFALVLLALVLGGCVTTGPHPWGSDATWKPARLRDAVVDAAENPRVWVPLAGAAVFQIDHWDRHASNWARRDTPVFGSQQSAQDWSDRLRTASSVAYFATVLATPGPPEPGPWIRDKAQGLLVGLAAIGVTGLTTGALKSATGRTRPNGEGNQSFPSGHASHSAVLTGLAHDNLEYMEISPLTRTALDVGLDGLSVGTAWARVEAGKHFPSDVLFGLALGNFVSRFFDRAFLGPVEDRNVAASFAPLPHGFELRVQLSY